MPPTIPPRQPPHSPPHTSRVRSGYSDDPRNTDNAWMETTACHFHCDEKLADELFASGRVVYRGYVDDPRNTDNAWIETTAFHYHCNMELGQMMPLKAGDDAADVMWLNVDDDEPKYKHLHASHREWVDQIRDEMRDEMAMRG